MTLREILIAIRENGPSYNGDGICDNVHVDMLDLPPDDFDMELTVQSHTAMAQVFGQRRLPSAAPYHGPKEGVRNHPQSVGPLHTLRPSPLGIA